tara:strand:- start:89 stop:403 length:315 start_codon:yes stop_codon:yes gene_type:complete
MSDTKPCPHCAELIKVDAKVCRFCSLHVATGQRAGVEAARKWSPGVAAVLSFFIPGLGQLYKGQILNGFFWMALTGTGYIFYILPGLVLHLLCVYGAYSGDPTK